MALERQQHSGKHAHPIRRARDADQNAVAWPTGSAMTAGQLSLHCTSFGVPFGLIADSYLVLAKMLASTPFGTETSIQDFQDSPQFFLLRCRESIGYRLVANDVVLADNADLQPLLDLLGRDLMVHVANHAPDRVFMHAGVVGWQGYALVLPGASFAVKTTLVAELVRSGATYYSDEYAVLDEHCYVYPYPRDLQMRQADSLEQVALPVEHLNGIAGTEPLPVSHVVFAEYAEGAGWNPEPISAGMAVLEMLRHTIPVQRTPARVMATLAKMMEAATALRSKRGEASEAARSLLLAMGARRQST